MNANMAANRGCPLL